MENPRRIVVIIGSDSDLSQCRDGFHRLNVAEKTGQADVIEVITMSIHQNTEYVLRRVKEFSDNKSADIFIVGAGWANHLTGTIDAYLRKGLQDGHIVVIGVPFEDKKDESHTETAIRSIIHVPATQVVYNKDWGFGSYAFLCACDTACDGELPKVKPQEAKKVKGRTLLEAIEAAIVKIIA